MSDLPLLSIVIVSWNVREDLRECLQSLLGTRDRGLGTGKLDFEVIVVDNASADGTVEMVKR
ncbi:MAG: glycosyltransferase, partial [Armatimonadetes bacterium]|nr:glycosyltransferase [Armatimonadota bacterium]